MTAGALAAAAEAACAAGALPPVRPVAADGGFLGRLLAGLHEPGDGLAHRHDGPFRGLHAGENAIACRLDFDDCLVGFDFEERFALGNALALFFFQLITLPVS